MKVAGIITEYNPFHLGHAYQIQETRKKLAVDYIIVVMSGNYVQRGEPALFDKWKRTELALCGGADIVLELPTPYACSSAELFAKGSVNLLSQTNCIDYLMFGSEEGELAPMKELAHFLNNEPPNYKNALHSELKSGLSYPKARSNAIQATYKDASVLLKGSNNILGIEYLRALETFKSPITPTTIKRLGSSYLNETLTQVMPSATAIRSYLRQSTLTSDTIKTLNNALPASVIENLLLDVPSLTPMYMHYVYPLLRHLLETQASSHADIYDLPDELFYRLVKKSRIHSTYDAFIEDAMSKNYTKATIQRSLIHLYLSLRQKDILAYTQYQDYNYYIRLLGFRKNASKLIHHMKKVSHLPLVTNFKDDYRTLSELGKKMLMQEYTYSNLYNYSVHSIYGQTKKDDFRQQIKIHSSV
jgi:predicted nucleotidyltransferase